MSPYALSVPTTTALGIAAALAFIAAAPLNGQNDGNPSRRALRAVRIEHGGIDLDGRLTDAAWQSAQVATDFTQRVPADGSPATERAEVRVLYTADALYVGVRAFDSEPEHIRAELARRDHRSQSDEIAVYFDSYHDRRTAFEFAVNPRGAIRDVYYFDDSNFKSDASWDPVWEVKTAVDSGGWTAEFRIPLTQLRFDREKTTWGFQVYRRIQRKAEETYWAPFPKDASGFVSLFGTLEGLEGLSQPLRLELRPYTVVNSRSRAEAPGPLYDPGHEMDGSAGLDLKYGITSDFTLDLSVNPDFGQVEADPAVINLTAFETFFPEKRPFFVEGSGLFSRSLPGGVLFYSRRIGRRPQGFPGPPAGGTVEIPEASSILGAAKITGKSARGLGLGLLSALTAREEATLRDSSGAVVGSEVVQPLTHHFAGRIEQDFRKGSHTVGAFVTAVNRSLPDNLKFLRSAAYVLELDGVHRWQNNTYAVRWQLAASHIRGSREAITAAQRSQFRYYQRPDATHVDVDTTRTSLSGYWLNLDLAKEAGTWQYGVHYGRISSGFEMSDMGFQWTTSDQQTASFFGEVVRARPWWIFRNYNLSIGVSRDWTTAGELTSTWFRPVFLRATFRNNWSLTLNPIAVGWNPLSVGALRGGPGLRGNPWRNQFANLTTDRRKPIALDVWSFRGGQFGAPGRWWGVTPSLILRPSGVVSGRVGLNYGWQRDPTQWVGRRTALDTTRYILAEIEQRTLSITTRLDWTLTPTLSVQVYGQPFVSAGTYGEYKEVTAPRAEEFDDRFRFYANDIACEEGAQCQVDLNRDGETDLSFPTPDFNFRQLRSTLVIRWEYRPGSVLFLAWQHGRQASLPDGSFGGFRDLGDLFSEDSDNTFLVKLNYWLSL